MSGLFGSVTIKGNRLTDLAGQTSTVGRPIGKGFGYVRVEEPNVIWTAGIPKEHVKKKKQGKGGVKTEEYTYTLSYAIAFIAGPVHKFLTIKRGGKVVYTTDPNASVDDKAYALRWLQKARLYLGTESQMPDATIESYVGAGKVCAHRGLCYIVVTDDDVTNEGGAVPQYEAVIVASAPDIYLTSRPYDIVNVEGFDHSMGLASGSHLTFPVEGLDNFMVFPDGQARNTLQVYDMLAEGLDSTMRMPDGTHRSTLQVYDKWPPESLDVTVMSFPEGSQKNTLIWYQNWPVEGINMTGMSFPDGTKTP